MRQTYFEVIYDLKDTTAQEDSTPSTLHNQSFADENYLKSAEKFSDYGTLEQDYFCLDGTMPELPDEPEKIPFWCSQLSDADGFYETNPLLTILFTQNHTSVGITLHFVGEVPLKMQIRWYDLSGNMISLKNYEPDTADFFAKNLVENYGRVEIEFRKAKPYRYVKLWGIDYGTELLWSEDHITKASLVEETDPLSNALKVNKLTFQLMDQENDFELTNSAGLHKALQKNQRLLPFEVCNGNRLFLGCYFLGKFSSDKGVVKMDTTDFIDMLDDTEYKDGGIYNGEPAGDVIAGIFDGTGIPYEVSEDVSVIPVYGWLKTQTRRKALREVLFACGAVAETARSECVRIYRQNRKAQSYIGRNRKFSTKVKRDAYVSAVNVKFSEYTTGSEEKELVKETVYPAGENEVRFNSPVSDLRISTGEIIKAHTNYIVFFLAEETSVIIYGRQYVKQDLTVTANIPLLKAGEKPGSKSFTGTLLNYQRAKELAEMILDYYQLSLILDIRYLAEQERPGAWAEVENVKAGLGNYLAGIESIKTDLTGGYISTAQLRGYYKLVTDFAYTGEEVYTAESVGVL